MLQLKLMTHLLALSRRLNYARAAEDLGISQSALTRSIQALEKQLGMRLFDRDRSGVALTPQGSLAVERCAVLLADAEDVERHLVLAAGAQAGRIRFGMAPLPASALLPLIVSERLGAASEVTHEVMVRDSDALWELLVAGEIEFFVTNEGFAYDSPRPRVEALGHFPIGGIVRASHPLLTGATADAKFPVIRSSWTGLPLPSSIKGRMRGLPNVIEDFGSLAKIAATSDAIWFSSPYAVPLELRNGALRELPRAQDDRPREVRILMYTLERRSQSPWARSIRDSLRLHIKKLSGGTDE
jgi:DNA-binding transcriptional LysR family regulator